MIIGELFSYEIFSFGFLVLCVSFVYLCLVSVWEY